MHSLLGGVRSFAGKLHFSPLSAGVRLFFASVAKMLESIVSRENCRKSLMNLSFNGKNIEASSKGSPVPRLAEHQYHVSCSMIHATPFTTICTARINVRCNIAANPGYI